MLSTSLAAIKCAAKGSKPCLSVFAAVAFTAPNFTGAFSSALIPSFSIFAKSFCNAFPIALQTSKRTSVASSENSKIERSSLSYSSMRCPGLGAGKTSIMPANAASLKLSVGSFVIRSIIWLAIFFWYPSQSLELKEPSLVLAIRSDMSPLNAVLSCKHSSTLQLAACFALASNSSETMVENLASIAVAIIGSKLLLSSATSASNAAIS